jgi:hypothetical protein
MPQELKKINTELLCESLQNIFYIAQSLLVQVQTLLIFHISDW